MSRGWGDKTKYKNMFVHGNSVKIDRVGAYYYTETLYCYTVTPKYGKVGANFSAQMINLTKIPL